MESGELLREEYMKLLKTQIDAHLNKSNALKEQDFIDEHNFEKIKLNVVEIFLKMFYASFNDVYGNQANTELTSNEKYEKLYSKYMAFFERIPSSWIEKSKKAKELKMVKEYVIEELKINTANEVKELFIEQYNKFKNPV